MKALITGASGFIGSTLIEDWVGRGHQAFALLRKTSDLSNLKGLTYTRVDGDLSNFEALKKAVAGMDYVFHLAGTVTAPNRAAFFKHNAEGTKLLAQAVAEAAPNLKRFVYVSSLAAAGPSLSRERPKTEADAATPVSSYGESKLGGERELLEFKDRFPIAIVRPPMVYGPKDKGVFVVIRTVSKRLMPMIRGGSPDGQKYYSLVHSRDLCDGVIRAALAPIEKVPSGEVFFVCGEGVFSYRELLLTMAEALQVKPFQLTVPSSAVTALAGALSAVGRVTGKTYPLNMDKLNEILPDYWICSNTKARDTLGFSPKYDLSAGMADAIQWYKDQRWL
jgi:nucleoside-diphosphate-sugar epimerase